MMQQTGPNKPADQIPVRPDREGFQEQNDDLVSLPRNILCGEAAIREMLAALDAAPIPLEEKVRQIENNELWPFLTGSRLKPEFRFQLEIADGLDELRLYKIDGLLDEHQLNSACSLDGVPKTLLATVPNPVLLFSAESIYKYADNGFREMLTQLYAEGRRISTYRGVSVTWDQSIDRKVWTTNIDTVNFINELFVDGVFSRGDIKQSLEIGVGGGGISKTVVAQVPQLEEHTATDISTYALMCAKRNIDPVLRPDQKLNLYLGKGLRSISASVDLLLVNPPYIPHMQKPDAVDPYRGTGLIKEIVEMGLDYLNPDSPNAAIYLGMSNLADKDLAEYLAANPRVKMHVIGTPREVPLKILNVNENKEWIEFLKRDHGLVCSEERLKNEGFEFWHTISVVKLTRA